MEFAYQCEQKNKDVTDYISDHVVFCCVDGFESRDG